MLLEIVSVNLLIKLELKGVISLVWIRYSIKANCFPLTSSQLYLHDNRYWQNWDTKPGPSLNCGIWRYLSLGYLNIVFYLY